MQYPISSIKTGNKFSYIKKRRKKLVLYIYIEFWIYDIKMFTLFQFSSVYYDTHEYARSKWRQNDRPVSFTRYLSRTNTNNVIRV